MMNPRVGIAILITLTGSAAGCVDGGDPIDDDDLEDLGTTTGEIANGSVVPIGELEAVGVVSGTCTGTLITDTLVVTAAHCICDDLITTSCADSASFTFKSVRRVDDPATPQDESLVRQDVSIGATPISHPDFGIGAYVANDIAVLKLRSPASSRVMVLPIPLAPTLPAVGNSLTLVGFGGAGVPCDGTFGTKRRGTTTVSQVIVGAAPGDITLRVVTSGPHTCPGDSGGPALDAGGRVAGVTSTLDSEKATFAYSEWLAIQNTSPGNRVGSFDLSGSSPVTVSEYQDTTPDPNGLLGWLDGGDVQIAGDFLDRGSDQVLYINRGGTGGKVRIAAYDGGVSPTESVFWESWGGPLTVFNQFIDSADTQLAGDFMGLGYDQLLLLNRDGSGRRIGILDFSTGSPFFWYLSTYTDDPLAGWHDSDDALVVGDFRNLGHDQLMFVNRDGINGRVMIGDFSDGVAPTDWVYYEAYSWGVQLNGWHDVGDLLLAGDFRDLGYDQAMFVNRGGGTGRVLVADFSDGVFPAEWVYYEAYGQSTLLDGYHDSTSDIALAGDFRGAGYDQVAFVNRNAPWFGRVLVADFLDGAAPVGVAFSQTQLQASPLLVRIDANDVVLAGDARGNGHPSLVTLERLEQ